MFDAAAKIALEVKVAELLHQKRGIILYLDTKSVSCDGKNRLYTTGDLLPGNEHWFDAFITSFKISVHIGQRRDDLFPLGATVSVNYKHGGLATMPGSNGVSMQTLVYCPDRSVWFTCEEAGEYRKERGLTHVVSL